ncbi:hypothetical protein HYG81_04975 [Natrinema zhouii]|uniref:Uncharacterized protein n=1 Tax=Natrinema zhouii TaxID=1710539 RepID=A0A7D6GW20_9EURY|nr:hypothetical protein [Natrinema zhouii]QLK26964.1 hypothetical protein HYG81_04975 [Natrinema zhouii]
MSQFSASESAVPADQSWRYGVYLFPLGPLSMLCSYAGLWLFTRATDAESIGVGVAAFIVTVLAGWLSYLFAAIVAIAISMDARALRDHPTWNPSPWLAVGAGLVHFAGAVLAGPYLLSVPAIAYYVYRRRQHVGGDGGRGSAESARDRATLE